MSSVAQHFIGVDLHDETLRYCVVGQDGEVLLEKKVSIPYLPAASRVLDEFEPWRQTGRIAVEAVGLNRWFVNGLLERSFEVVVADPIKLNLKVLGKKTDKRDAREIARRLWLGDIDRAAATYYPSDEEYGDRKLERTRHKLKQMQQRTANQIRSILRAYKIQPPATTLHSRQGLQGLSEGYFVNDQMTACVHALARALEEITASIDALQLEIDKRARELTAVRLVDRLPGVGPLTALTIVRELGDVHRFRNAKAVASYAGLVPKVVESADRSHHGRLTKRGNRCLRFLVSQWAVRMMGNHHLVQAWAAPRLKRQHKNKVRLTLARKLLVGVWVMLTRGEVFDLETCLGRA